MARQGRRRYDPPFRRVPGGVNRVAKSLAFVEARKTLDAYRPARLVEIDNRRHAQGDLSAPRSECLFPGVVMTSSPSQGFEPAGKRDRRTR